MCNCRTEAEEASLFNEPVPYSISLANISSLQIAVSKNYVGTQYIFET